MHYTSPFSISSSSRSQCRRQCSLYAGCEYRISTNPLTASASGASSNKKLMHLDITLPNTNTPRQWWTVSHRLPCCSTLVPLLRTPRNDLNGNWVLPCETSSCSYFSLLHLNNDTVWLLNSVLGSEESPISHNEDGGRWLLPVTSYFAGWYRRSLPLVMPAQQCREACSSCVT